MPDDIADESDAGLVRRALDGDQIAVSALIDRHADAVYEACWATLAVEDAAFDAVHTIFLRAGKRLSKLTDPSRLREWLLAIARRELAGHQRRRPFTQGSISVESTSTSVPSQKDVAVPAGRRHRIAVDMMVALGFGPAVPVGQPGSLGYATSFRFSELWPSTSSDQDDWEWRQDGFPLDWSGAAQLPGMLILATIAAALALLLAVLTLPLLRSSPEVEVAGVVESTTDVARDDENARLLGDPGEVTATFDSTSASASTAGATTAVQPTLTTQPNTTTGPTSPVEPTSTTLAATRTTATTAGLSRVTSTSSAVVDTSTTAVAETSGSSPTTAASTTTGAATTTTAASTTTTGAATTTTAASTTTTAASTTTTSTTTTSTTTTSTTTTSTTSTTLAPNLPPTVESPDISPGSIRVSDGGCVPGTATISARVTDGDGSIVAVVAEWSANGQDTISTPLNDVGNQIFEASVGPWFIVGRQTVVVVATDDDGAEAQRSDSIQVRSCPGN